MLRAAAPLVLSLSMHRSHTSVDTGNAKSIYLPAGIALEERFVLTNYQN